MVTHALLRRKVYVLGTKRHHACEYEQEGKVPIRLLLCAGALLALLAGGTAEARSSSSGVPGCDSRWGSEFTWCIGVRPRHVVITLPAAMVGYLEVYRGAKLTPNQRPVVSMMRLVSGDIATTWQTPRLKPGLYVVNGRASPALCYAEGRGCIAIVYGLGGIVRVPARAAHVRPQ